MGEHRYLLLILAVYFALVANYFFTVPLFEAPDDYYHFAVVEYVARKHELPFPSDTRSVHGQPWRQMAFHAPLYYLVGSLLIRPIDTEDFVEYHLNPHAAIGEPGAKDNRNFIAHAGDPWYGTGLAARVMRLFSMMLGGITLTGVFLLAKGMFGQNQTLNVVAILIVTLNPQFLFLHASVSNDTLLVALSTLIIALLVRIIRKGLTVRRILVLSVLLALNSIAKASGFSFYGLFGLFMVYVVNRDRISLPKLSIYMIMASLFFLTIAGWWYWRNLALYGDPTGTTLIANATQARFGAIDVVGELRGMFFSFWGLFGWFNILAPSVFYLWVAVICSIGLVGSAGALMSRWKSIGRDDRAVIVIFSLFSVMFFAEWWWFNTRVQAAQGRLIFPLLGPTACMLAYGWTWFRIRWLGLALLLPLLVSASIFPWTTIRPVYAPAQQVSREVWDPSPHMVSVPLRQPWEEDACLNVWLNPPTWDGKSDRIVVEIAWEAACTVSGYWSVFVHFSDLGRETCVTGDTSHVLSQYDSMPEGGRTPFPAIRPGHVLVDQMFVPIPEDISWDRDWHIQVGIYDASGSFIRAFFVPEDAYGLANSERIFIGNCSPELVNLKILRDPP